MVIFGLMIVSSVHNLRKSINDMILSLQDIFLLEREEDTAGFLGINILRDEMNNTIIMTQTGLINRILNSIDVVNVNAKYTPSKK